LPAIAFRKLILVGGNWPLRWSRIDSDPFEQARNPPGDVERGTRGVIEKAETAGRRDQGMPRELPETPVSLAACSQRKNRLSAVRPSSLDQVGTRPKATCPPSRMNARALRLAQNRSRPAWASNERMSGFACSMGKKRLRNSGARPLPLRLAGSLRDHAAGSRNGSPPRLRLREAERGLIEEEQHGSPGRPEPLDLPEREIRHVAGAGIEEADVVNKRPAPIEEIKGERNRALHLPLDGHRAAEVSHGEGLLEGEEACRVIFVEPWISGLKPCLQLPESPGFDLVSVRGPAAFEQIFNPYQALLDDPLALAALRELRPERNSRGSLGHEPDGGTRVSPGKAADSGHAPLRQEQWMVRLGGSR